MLAHELTHVIQQGNPDSDLGIARRVSHPGDASERAAAAVARAVTTKPPPAIGVTPIAQHEVERLRGPAAQPVSAIASSPVPEVLEPTIRRYSHEDCTDADLKAHIWPADFIARQKVAAAITAVTTSPISSTTEGLLAKYFMTRSPDVSAIAKVFRSVKAAFDGDSYTYECEDDCDSSTNAYSGRFWDIHLCMNNIRGRANDCIARTIIHEFTHKYAGTGHGWWFSTAACYNGCDTSGCPADLDADDALDNAYSYAGFAHEI